MESETKTCSSGGELSAFLCATLTLSIMHFEDSEPWHVVSQHNLVGTCSFVHTLYDLKITVREIEVTFMDRHTPRVRQACYYGDTVTPIRIPTLNLCVNSR